MNNGIQFRLPTRALLAATCALLAAGFFAPSSAVAASSFTILGGGWGHGIGLSQYGAQGYALQGKSHSWILAHYYQGTRLVTKPSATVRVNLDNGKAARSSWRIQAGSTTPLTVSLSSDAAVKITLDTTSTYWITSVNGDTRVHENVNGKAGRILKTFNGACVAKAGSLVRIVSASGPFDHSSVAWRGSIRFNPKTGTSSTYAVNYVGIESYLYGVVPRESPASWNPEALKAQAVAARSYAYQDAVEGRELWCTTMSQVYNGYGRPTERHEDDRTNAAVNATAGQVVWYGTETEPVKTFFSSSSGGHTANIEDVWVSSTPKPYYKGVTDADQANSNYRWSYSASGATIGSKIRAKDANGEDGLQYSAPYPASVTGISLERAASGYAHHVNLRWSNGYSSRILGTTLQSALGLKSTHYWMKPTSASYEQTDKRLAYAGAWSSITRSGSYGGSSKRAKAAESRIWITYHGTGFRWVGTKAASFGKASVYVDGRYVTTVDQYASRTTDKQTIYSISSQADTTHTVSIRVRGLKRSTSTNSWVDVDRFYVTYGTGDSALVTETVPVASFEETSTCLLTFGSGWLPGTTNNGAQVYSGSAGDRAFVTFIGDRFRWLGRTGSNRGKARITVDGVPHVVDSYSPATVERATVFDSGVMPWKTHQVAIEVLGEHDAASTGNIVSLDAFEMPGGVPKAPVVPVARYQDNNTAIIWTGPWSAVSSTSYSSGTARYSFATSATVTVRFTGTSVAWVGSKTPYSGKAAVYVDGTRVSTVDCYRSSNLHRATLFSKTGLALGDHELKIVPLRTRATASKGYNVLVDAFDVGGWLR